MDGLDGNGLQLEKIGQFSQVLLADFGEIANNLFNLYFVLHWRNQLIFPSRRSTNNFLLERKGSVLNI